MNALVQYLVLLADPGVAARLLWRLVQLCALIGGMRAFVEWVW